jgi:hypothetical protein
MSNTDSKHITQISEDNQVITLINVFTVEPQNQERLIEILEQATEEVMRHLPGLCQQTYTVVWMVPEW